MSIDVPWTFMGEVYGQESKTSAVSEWYGCPVARHPWDGWNGHAEEGTKIS